MKKSFKKDGMSAYLRFKLPPALLADYERACEQTAHKKSEILRRLIDAWIAAGAPSPPFALQSTAQSLSNMNVISIETEANEQKRPTKKTALAIRA